MLYAIMRIHQTELQNSTKMAEPAKHTNLGSKEMSKYTVTVLTWTSGTGQEPPGSANFNLQFGALHIPQFLWHNPNHSNKSDMNTLFMWMLGQEKNDHGCTTHACLVISWTSQIHLVLLCDEHQNARYLKRIMLPSAMCEYRLSGSCSGTFHLIWILPSTTVLSSMPERLGLTNYCLIFTEMADNKVLFAPNIFWGIDIYFELCQNISLNLSFSGWHLKYNGTFRKKATSSFLLVRAWLLMHTHGGAGVAFYGTFSAFLYI